jgi:tetratricopeptide (TPR) repeat protein
MNRLKTLTLALMLIIFSVTGLQAKEVSFDQLVQLYREGNQAYKIYDYPTALEKWEQGLSLSRQANHQRAISVFLGNLGLVYDDLGQYPKAIDYYQQALVIKREIGDKKGIGNNLTNLGVVYWNLGQYPKAIDYYQQALVIKRKIGDQKKISAKGRRRK